MESIYRHIYFEGKNFIDTKDEDAMNNIINAAQVLEGLQRGIARYPEAVISIDKNGMVKCSGFPDALSNVITEMLRRSDKFFK